MWWHNFLHSASNQLALFKITDVIDIALVSYIVYKALRFIRDTRTAQLLKGIVLVIVIMQVSYFAKLNTIYYILSNFMQLGVIVLLIVFQPELRRVLEQVGRVTGEKFFVSHNEFGAENLTVIREISKAAQTMASTKTGALIVIENKDNIDELVSSGISLNAKVSSQLLENIFVPDTPLHDGAVVVRKNKAELASCVLPLSQNPRINTSYGTRHRAGIGISEESDAIAVIVSEETGKISVAYKGEFTSGYNEETLRKILTDLMSREHENDNSKNIFKVGSSSKRRHN